MMRPASITPSMTARLLRLKSQSRMEAARAPVQAPVPGRGIPTKSNKAQKIPLSPAASMTFIETPAKKASNDRFFGAPSKNMAGEEEDQRDREKISDHSD